MAASTSTPLLAEETDSFTQAEPVVPDAAPAEPAVEEAEAPVVEEVETAVVEEAEEAVVETESEAESELLADQEPVMEDQLELVPPSAESDLDSAYGFEESQDEIADASVNTATLRESLARTEEDLITQQQQNEYLADRIEELEAQLATADDGNVKDADLANMEDRLRQERIDQAASEEAAKPWYSKFSAWLIGLLVLVAAGGGWLLSRRGGAQEFVSDQASGEEQIKEIKGEAEDLLRVLEDSDSPVEETAEEAEKEVADEKPAAKTFEASGDDAEVLDEESSDPEIQLDLARAYISMGDKEAARVILEEVSNNGNEAQRDEAKKMLDLLVS
jgi:pilus assembly protein FimV